MSFSWSSSIIWNFDQDSAFYETFRNRRKGSYSCWVRVFMSILVAVCPSCGRPVSSCDLHPYLVWSTIGGIGIISIRWQHGAARWSFEGNKISQGLQKSSNILSASIAYLSEMADFFFILRSSFWSMEDEIRTYWMLVNRLCTVLASLFFPVVLTHQMKFLWSVKHVWKVKTRRWQNPFCNAAA